MQRERWYEDFIEGAGSSSAVQQSADVQLKPTETAEPTEDEFQDLPAE